MRIRHIPFLFIVLTSYAMSGCALDTSKQPNILIILVDDMGYSEIGCFGGEIPTPNIDQLAEGGLRMTNFYNAARCCPSRASLLTGLYPHKAGMGHQNQDRNHPSYRGRIKSSATTIAEILQANNYATYQVGKWHVGNDKAYWPGEKGFDQYFTLIEGAMNYYNQWPWVRNQKPIQLTYNGEPYTTGEDFYATSTFTDTATAFIERHSKNQPFLMYLAYNAPHWPLHAPQEDIEKYRGKFMTGWDKLRENRFERMKELGVLKANTILSKRFHSVPAWDSLSLTDQKDWDLKMALYAAVMENLDKGIGKVVNALRNTDQLNNTLIFFLSDNGACHEDPVPPDAPWSNHPTDGLPGSERSFPSYGIPWANACNTPYSYFKSYLHEGGIATPLIVHYPDQIPQGQINHQTLGHIMDILPTCLDFTNVEYPTAVNSRIIDQTTGISLLPAFTGEEQTGHTKLYWEHQFNRAVRNGDWKLVSAYRILEQNGIYDKWELYDLKNDPTEHHNLADQFPEKVAELQSAYAQWAKASEVLNPEEMKALNKK